MAHSKGRFALCAASLALCGVLSAYPLVRADSSCGGVKLPAKVDAFGNTLVLNGAGIRHATVFNVQVYVAGLYLPRPTQDVAAILEPSQPKELSLHFTRDVSRSEMVDAIREGVENNAGANQAVAKQRMKHFERLIPELKDGSELRFAYDEARGLEIRHNGKLLGVEKNGAFAQLLFRVWLGSKPPDAKLKAGLLGGKCG